MPVCFTCSPIPFSSFALQTAATIGNSGSNSVSSPDPQGMGTSSPPSWIHLESWLTELVPLLHAVESLLLSPTTATSLPPAPALATLESPCEVWQVPSLEMLPLELPTPVTMPSSPPTCALSTAKLFVEPLEVVDESAFKTS